MGEVTTHRAKRPHAKGGKGKSFSVWVRQGRAKKPNAKEALRDALSLTARGIGKSLRLWGRLGKADRPHAKIGTYHASVFGF